MASNAERQAAYRARRLTGLDADCERLNTVVSVGAKRALERLSRHLGMTQREILETLLTQAEHDATQGMDANADREYFETRYGVTTRLIDDRACDDRPSFKGGCFDRIAESRRPRRTGSYMT